MVEMRWIPAKTTAAGVDDASGQAAPPEATYIGQYENHQLYTLDQEAYRQFILFVLEATNEGTSTGQSGKNQTHYQSFGWPAQPTYIPPGL